MAYLMPFIGPGTTAADEIASNSFSYSYTADYLPIEVFSDLTLGPGSYYLVIGAVSGGYLNWANAGPDPAIVEAPGVTSAMYRAFNFGGIAYAPAESFGEQDWNQLLFTVTGGPAGAGVPEPATFGLFGGAVLLLGFARKRRLS